MPSLFVIRHAEPRIKGVLLGQCDPSLSEAGVEQASRLRGSIVFEAIYASPLRRAVQTARYLHSSPTILHEFSEITYGLWDGSRWIDIEAKWPQLAVEKLENWTGICPPEGEDWNAFRGRVLHGLAIVKSGKLPAVIVAHEAVNAVIAKELAGSEVHSYKQKYCEIIRYEI